ncbi:MAG: hypothetical protein E6G97_06260 [Alphaproteobacteria bacterium]|nr:MAG: hypothetical protein E6G97_06260 [Alphaproteobacteria bacterium]
MSIKHRAALALFVVLGSTSFALAQGFDPNLGNRIPLLNEPLVYGYGGGGGGGTSWLLPDAPSATIQSAPVGLYGGGPYGRRYGALRTAPVALGQGAYGAYQGSDDGYAGPYRQDAIAAGMASLYGRSYDSGTYQTAPVGLYGGGYGLRTSQVGLYRRPYAAGRMYRRGYGGYGGFRGARVGLYGGYGGYGGYGALQTAPVSLYNYVYQTPFNVDRADRASSPYAGGGF